jgi:SnoaL-like protein
MPASDDPAVVLTRLLQAVDDLDWTAARDCLADEVRTDYSELFGGDAETLAADELVMRWHALLPGFDATQHLLGTGLVEERAGGLTVRTHVRAYHRVGGAVWGVHGHYVVPLERSATGWKIAGITLRLFYQEGDTDLPALAGERAAAAPRTARPR